MASQFFRTKDADQLIRESEQPDRQMKRTLSALDLTALGIGAIIGAGIFSLTGTAAAGESFGTKIETPVVNYIVAFLNGSAVELGRAGAGPAVTISLVVAALACAFAALCYAEMASMIPISGSAYTYSYATLGELVAWIIGWDLILEYAVGNMAVAASWSGYFRAFLNSTLGIKLPLWLSADHTTAMNVLNDAKKMAEYSSHALPTIAGHQIAINVPAALIVFALTVVLVYGIKESTRANSIMVIVKVAVVIFFAAFGAFYLNPTNWSPFTPNGFTGVMSGAAIIFFAFIGFDAVSTTAEETRNPQRDLPVGMIASLVICTVLYVAVSLVLTGLKKYTEFEGDAAALATAVGGMRWVQALISAGALAGTTSVLLVFQLGQPRIFMAMARDGLLPQYFAKIHQRFRTPHITTIWTGVIVGAVAMVTDIGTLANLTNIGTLFAFILVCFGVIALRRRAPDMRRPFRVPLVPLFPIIGALLCFGLMLSLSVETWLRFFVWLVIGLLIYFLYGANHSKLREAKVEKLI
jgi:APA family basic amino acid/polyamine antiporter